jgi:hypothetical protein
MAIPASQYDAQERILHEVGIKAGRLMGGVENELWRRIQSYLRRLDTKNGKFVSSDSSQQVLAAIRRELSKFLRETQVSEFMKDVMVDFDGIAENLNYLHREENNITVPRSLVTGQKRIAVEELKNSLFGAGYDARFAEPVQKALYNSINFGADVVETERMLRTMVHGIDGAGGLMERHVGTVARDSLRQYRGRLNKAIEEEHGLEFLRYVGNIIRDSRWQCRRWVDMEYLRNADLAKEVRLAFRKGRGMIPGTNKETLVIYCGGYNCLHTAFPVREIEKR